MKFLQLKQHLNNPSSIYTVTGDDDFLISQAIKIIKQVLVTDFDEFNYLKVDMDLTPTSDYANIINTMPFGLGYRVVVFISPTSEQVKVINSLTKDLGQVVVVCVTPASKIENAENIDCSHLDKADLIKWVNNYLFKANLKIEKRAFDYIIDMSQGDLAYLNTELPKLEAYIGEDIITIEAVNQTFTKNHNYFVYHLTNAIDSRDIKSQFDILNSLTLAQNVGDIYAFLGPYFRRMFYCSVSKSSDEELASILKVKPYAITKARQYVVKNKAQYYINYYLKYIELDYNIKSGKISSQNAMYELLLNIS